MMISRFSRRASAVMRHPSRVARRMLTSKHAAGLAVQTGGRLVPNPVFVISSVRSGSTLLRVLLNSHSELCAPHELHLRHVKVSVAKKHAELAVQQLDLDVAELEHLLWDRIMHRELVRSGKNIFVDKTPGNTIVWRRLRQAWPKAKFIILLRHPAASAASEAAAHPDWRSGRAEEAILFYTQRVEKARRALGGRALTVRYEDLTTDPERVTRELCAFIGVRWERGMLEYGRQEHGPYARGIGDWSEKIRSGRVHPAPPPPAVDEIPESLRDIAAAWGYLESNVGGRTPADAG